MGDLPGDKAFLADYFGLLHAGAQLSEALVADLAFIRDMWLETNRAGGKIIFLGNGGSAGIASHLAIDLSKNGGLTATCFNDAAMLTCLANDYGYEHMFAHAVRIYGGPNDTVVAISSSGKSPNILNACDMAKSMGMKLVTLSGMSPTNPLRTKGDVNLWLESRAYNIVETIHQFWMMSVIDLIIGTAEYPADRVTGRRTA